MQRTNKQNASLHKWCEELATEANNQGVSMKAIVTNLEVDWSSEAIKSIIRAIAKAKYGKTSTADLTTKELSDCCEETGRIFLEQGIFIEFPSFEGMSFNSHYSK